ncbi:prolyl-tRNA synthetase associated domain-containing protein [Asticcacaulis excentricus]|uniref:YbaK/prolyl-tRNA synthetase associated region n=1 Tax=Asticcacaulis excentricus (strain ATCC 15261 / DSM 4724 / KCTC 12464 / NCIMB 9791 / VKM B-1370 / CB 48) TaxID=573065 RepID=E8RNH1_ASTEC|nr:prolyl-tRNA synthetase associated domain-containing protein [Asticcacaulis excentricus]ADU11802.1 YbaK/prolyl-tRNA synthetase associated region [Asticcacaulis excentricus CB 48]
MTENSFYTQSTLLQALNGWGLLPRTTEHEAVFRVGEGEGIKDSLPGAHTKNLFLKDDKGQLWLISAEQQTQINLKALPKVIGSGRLSFGSEERLYQALGVRPGSVTALALINDPEHNVKFILDQRLYEAEIVNFHPLINTATTALDQGDFRLFLDKLRRDYRVIDFSDV